MTRLVESPAAQVAAGNPWYTDSQFRAQMRTAGRRRVVEDRWKLFGAIVDAWRAAAPFTLLDAGCGDGINLFGLGQLAAERSWPVRLIGADYNALRLARAREQATGAAGLVLASLTSLPYAPASIDAILCSHVLEHVPDLAGVLAEFRRVLPPGGLLIVAVPNEGCAMARLRNRVLQRQVAHTTDHVHFFTAGTLQRQLETAGFRDVRLARETFFFPVTYLNMACNEFRAGHALMRGLRSCFPSQAGGLIAAAVNP